MKSFYLTVVLFFSILAASPQNKEAGESGICYEGRVGLYKGRNVFFINDEPYAPLMYSGTEQGRKTWMDPTRRSIQEFTAQGYEIIQTDTWFKYLMNEQGEFDIPQIQKQIAAILDINPKAKIVVRINVSAPKWWLEKHPEELCEITNPNGDDSFSGNSAESLASDLYREFAQKHLEEFLCEIMKIPESNHIIGFHIGGGVYGEWHYYGIRNEPDKSEPMKRRFACYGIRKYGSLKEANKRWHTDFPDIHEVDVPTYEQRYNTGDGDYRDPEKDQFVIDYYRCQQETISSLVEDLARIVKETWPRPVITGVFFGYLYGGFTVGAEAGQNDIERIFRSPYLDYFAGPYFSRNMDGSGCYRSLAASCALYGKIWLTEHDGGTHLGGSGSGTATFPGIPANEQQTIARMRRNYMYSITENGGQWWYDFGPRSQGGGWWGTPGLLEEAKNLLDLSKRYIETEFEKPSDVLLVHDMESYYYMRPRKEDKISGRLVEGLADAILGTGVAFDKIFMMDLPKIDLSQYKTIIFSNTICLDEKEREFIKNNIIREGYNVLFMSGAGYTDGTGNSPGLISSLTGIHINRLPEPATLEIIMGDNKYTVSPDGIEIFFYADDAESKVIGRYTSGEAGAVFKKVNGCNVYYLGVPLTNESGVYKDLLKETGCRTYAGNLLEKDYVSVGGGIIGLYSVKGGKKIIKPLNGKYSEVFFPPYSCYYFDMHTGKQLNQ